MHSAWMAFGIAMAVIITAGTADAQNTLLLGQGQRPRVTTVPPQPNYGYQMNGTQDQFFSPAQPQAYRMPNGRYQVITPVPRRPQ
jgi:hypothetical protein